MMAVWVTLIWAGSVRSTPTIAQPTDDDSTTAPTAPSADIADVPSDDGEWRNDATALAPSNTGLDPCLDECVERLLSATTPRKTPPDTGDTGDGVPTWRAWAESRGWQFDARGRVVVEADANGQFSVWVDGHQRRPIARISPTLRGALATAFPDVQLVPGQSPTRLRAWVPLATVRPFYAWLRAHVPDVTVGPLPMPIPTFGAIVSEGVAATRADGFHTNGITGAGVRVALIDTAFGAIDTHATEIGTYSHHPSQPNFAGDVSAHGTACAELLRDVAPNVDLTLLRLDAGLDIETATSFALSQGAQVFSSSVVFFGFPGNGASCDAARAAVNAGAVWVNSAGNFSAGAYWETATPVFGANVFLDFQPSIELNQIVPSAAPVTITFSYERPNATFAQMHAQIWQQDGGNLQMLGEGNGATAQHFTFTPTSGLAYFVAVRRATTGTNGRMRFQANNADFAINETDGSIANPAAVPDVIAVGAVTVGDYSSAGSVAAFSSRGGGAFDLELDCCGPTDCRTASFGFFGGTSAACPHIAGLFALALSYDAFAFPAFDFFDFFDVAPAGPDNASGRGLAACFTAAFQSTSTDPFEPNDTMTQATALGSATIIQTPMRLDPATDDDWFRFTLAEARGVSIATVGNPASDTRLSLHDDQGTPLAADNDNGRGKLSRMIRANLPAGTYFVRVWENGHDQVVPAYSLAVGIGTANATPPEAVPLSAPATGVTGQPTSLTFSWQVPGGRTPLTYQLQVARDNAFGLLVHDAPNLTGTSRAVSGLPVDSTLYWRVRAKNRLGNGPWSMTRTLITAVAPGTPTPSTPSDGATGVGTTVELRWHTPTGTAPLSYSLQIATDSGFSALVVNQTGLTSNFRQVADLPVSTTFFWRVQATNALGSGPVSPPAQFTTAATVTPTVGPVGGKGGCTTPTTINGGMPSASTARPVPADPAFGLALIALAVVVAARRRRHRRHFRHCTVLSTDPRK